jgi:CheY-like chemotaxis protein
MKKLIIAKSVLETIGKGNTLFGRGGIEVHIAGTSEEVLDLHRRIRADLIITEFSLPTMNGAELCSAIRKEPGLKEVSLVVACDASRVFESACREAGANAIITRPVDPFELFSKIAELIVVPQRKDMRVLLRVSVNGADQEISFIATSYNISISGMLLETKHEVRNGDRLRCTFSIAHAEITAECDVMRVDRTDAGRFRYGVKFLNLDTKSIIIIDNYVKNRIRQ